MSQSTAPTAARARYRTYVLTLLTIFYFLYLLDRTAIMVTQEMIKPEFRLSDTQMGLVIGTVYGISGAIAGLPLGRLVDRVNRRNLLVVILSVWSVLTALCGASSAYWQFILIRIGVAGAEAGGSPTSLSILSDLYPPQRRATAASIFYSGIGFGMIVSFFVGGLIAREYGWRAVFLLFGLPGVALALLILFTVREPVRDVGEAIVRAPSDGILKTAWRLLRTPILGRVYLGAALYCLATTSVGSWMIAFLMRVHAMDVATAGLTIAVASGVCGIAGSILTGFCADRAVMRSAGGPLFVMAIAAAINLLFGTIALHTGNTTILVICLCVFGATMTAYSGVTNAVISELAPPHARGIAFALFALLANLVGAGLGPIAVGFISDRDGGALGTAMQIMLSVNVLAALIFAGLGRRVDARGRSAG